MMLAVPLFQSTAAATGVQVVHAMVRNVHLYTSKLYSSLSSVYYK